MQIEISSYFPYLYLRYRILWSPILGKSYLFHAIEAILISIFAQIDRYFNHLLDQELTFIIWIDSGVERDIIQSVNFIDGFEFWVAD